VGSVFLSTHFDPHRSGLGETQLDEHIGEPLVVEQSAVGAVHAFVQLPQVWGRVRSVSQPSSGLDEQCPKPLAQPAAWMTHAPATHCTAGAVAPGFTLGKEVQAWPHAPQFFASVIRFTHWVPHTFGDDPLQLGRQLAGWVWVEQSGVAPLQARVQLPQCAGVVRAASQPSLGCAEQWAYPAAQAAGGT
jgi:hypothetical protein